MAGIMLLAVLCLVVSAPASAQVLRGPRRRDRVRGCERVLRG